MKKIDCPSALYFLLSGLMVLGGVSQWSHPAIAADKGSAAKRSVETQLKNNIKKEAPEIKVAESEEESQTPELPDIPASVPGVPSTLPRIPQGPPSVPQAPSSGVAQLPHIPSAPKVPGLPGPFVQKLPPKPDAPPVNALEEHKKALKKLKTEQKKPKL